MKNCNSLFMRGWNEPKEHYSLSGPAGLTMHNNLHHLKGTLSVKDQLLCSAPCKIMANLEEDGTSFYI